MANQGEAKVNHLVILRGPLVPEINVAITDRGVRALTEKHECNLLAPKNSKQSESDQEISSHGIVDPSGITVDLGKPLWINHIGFRLPDKDPPSYSYYVEVSKNLNDWRRVVDHSSYCCRSLQELYLEPTACRYIRVVGTKSPLHDSFSLVSFEAVFTEKPFCLKQGIVVPESNVASLEMGACVIEGVNQHGDSRDRQRMINGDWTDIDAFTRHKIGAGAVIVQLAQPYVIDSLHMLLWHWDSRKYSYYIETSTDMKEWTRIVDHSSRHCHSWQLFRFEARPIVFIKIVGTACTAPGTDGLWFDIAYLGCPIDDC